MLLRNGRHGSFWGCRAYPLCPGTVGADSDGNPVGAPATVATRKARIAAAEIVAALWRVGGMSRANAYKWLTMAMGRRVYIMESDEATCQLVASLTTKLLIQRLQARDAPPMGRGQEYGERERYPDTDHGDDDFDGFMFD